MVGLCDVAEPTHMCEEAEPYVALCKLVRQAVKKDKEKWWDTNMAADLRGCRQGD